MGPIVGGAIAAGIVGYQIWQASKTSDNEVQQKAVAEMLRAARTARTGVKASKKAKKKLGAGLDEAASSVGDVESVLNDIMGDRPVPIPGSPRAEYMDMMAAPPGPPASHGGEPMTEQPPSPTPHDSYQDMLDPLSGSQLSSAGANAVGNDPVLTRIRSLIGSPEMRDQLLLRAHTAQRKPTVLDLVGVPV